MSGDYRRIWLISPGLISGFRRHRALGTWAYQLGGLIVRFAY
jgi:hypothetical protein